MSWTACPALFSKRVSRGRALILALCAALLAAGCESSGRSDDDDLEEIAEETDDVFDETDDALEEAGDEIEDAFDELD